MAGKVFGSWSSPIPIDDSEEEVANELCNVSSELDTPPSYLPGLQDDELNYPQERTIYDVEADREYLEYGNTYEPPPIPQALKRKRGMNNMEHHGEPVPGPSNSEYGLEARFWLPESKKARKRRRKLERQAMETEAQQMNNMNDFPPENFVMAWPGSGTAFDPYQIPPTPQPVSSYNRRAHQPSQSMQDLTTPLRYSAQSYGIDDHYSTQSPATSSAWVSSMALAAEYPTIQSDPWTTFSSPHIPTPPVHSVHLTSPTRRDRNTTPDYPGFQASHPHSLPAKSTPSQTIGMKPDQDPNSKHGIFNITSTTAATTIPQTPDTSKKDAYIPNPARTLVMEQLPKTHRTKDFVNSWSKSACGAHPVYLAIDAPAGKALVEFATAELARKAWGSPKLGATVAGLRPFQLKGKPREDLIRVWWYRVDGVGAGGGVGEIEEGEIEGDAAEREVDVPFKKETKKQRKARLAKERQAKKDTENASNVKTNEPLKQSPAPSVDLTSSSPVLHSLPPPAPTHFSTVIPIMPTPVIYHYHQLPQRPLQYRPPLLPQSHLETHWRENPMTSFGASLKADNTNNDDDRASIASSRHGYSIASSRSPSPNEHNAGSASTRSMDEDEGYLSQRSEDMQIETEDMELETPDSKVTISSQSSNAPRGEPVSPTPKAIPSQALLIPASPVPRMGQPLNHILPDDRAPMSQPPPVIDMTLPTPTPTPHVPIFLSPFENGSAFVSSPSTSTATTSRSSTPTSAPSEPRAMKNAPKGPSYAKRSLLARQKELEERIARSKLELRRATAMTKEPVTVVQQDPLESKSGSTTPPAPMQTQDIDGAGKQLMEDNLRKLVLASQKNKNKPVPAPNTVSTSSRGLDSFPAGAVSASPSTHDPKAAPPTTSVRVPLPSIPAFSLDDLAVSFITETIQTLKPSSPSPVPPPVHKATSYTNAKHELAAKQKRLERHISESKILMDKLTQARTKQEKDSILAIMREKSRMMEQENETLSPPTTANTNYQSDRSSTSSQSSSARARWPDSHHSVGVFDVSDEEESDYED